METTVNDVKGHVFRLVRAMNDSTWEYCDIFIEFLPITTKGYQMKHLFFNNIGEKLELFFWPDEEMDNCVYAFIQTINQDNAFNVLKVSCKKNDIENGAVDIYFDRILDDAFQNQLPKSKRGKTIPWWKQPQ